MSRLSRLHRRDADLEYLTVGSGAPNTVFAHGLAGSIETTRPFGSGVRGTRTFFHFRGHGASSAPEDGWTYAGLAAELRDVADHVHATQALGVSMGAGALCHLLAKHPQRFERAVFVLPALIDQRRYDAAFSRMRHLAELVDNRDLQGLTEQLVSEQPEPMRYEPGLRSWCAAQARQLSGTAVSRALRQLPAEVPVANPEALTRVEARCLVLAQEEDLLHPSGIARELAGLLPQCELVVLPPGGIMWTHRGEVRRRITAFLGDMSPAVEVPVMGSGRIAGHQRGGETR